MMVEMMLKFAVILWLTYFGIKYSLNILTFMLGLFATAFKAMKPSRKRNKTKSTTQGATRV